MIIPGLFLVLPQAPPPFVPVPMQRGFWSRRARPAVEGGRAMVGPTSTNGPAADLALPAYGPSLQAPPKPGNHPLPKQLRFPGKGKETNGKKNYNLPK